MLKRSIAAITACTFLLSACTNQVGGLITAAALAAASPAVSLGAYILGAGVAYNATTDPCRYSTELDENKIYLLRADPKDFFELRKADWLPRSGKLNFECFLPIISAGVPRKVLVQSSDFKSTLQNENLSRRRTAKLVQYLRDSNYTSVSELSITELKDRRLQETARRLLRENPDIVLLYIGKR